MLSPNTNGIRSARVRANKTQVQLADAIGVSERTVMRWELGRTMPRGDDLRKTWIYLRHFVKDLDLAELLPAPKGKR